MPEISRFLGIVITMYFIVSDLRPIVKALRDRNLFSAIRVEMDTVVWENGFDLAPEFRRAMAKPRVPA